jgi:tRNA-specific 2-thiouridylase
MRGMSRDRIVVAMSGGVDSSVTALLLRDAGYRVTGFHMRFAAPSPGTGGGDRGSEAAGDARRVAGWLGIPLHEADLRVEFGRIVDGFVAEYRRGRTPNPCVICNRELKFNRLLGFAAGTGADLVATGHYARVKDHGGRRAVRRGADPAKDQSYVLFALSQEQLRRTVLPLGGTTKEEVRSIARRAGLPVAERPESQDACFVPEGGYRELLRSRGPLVPGVIRDEEGRIVGRHGGVELFTVGQRKGIGAHGAPRYVLSVEPLTRTVRIGPRESLCRMELVAGEWVGCGREAPEAGEEFAAAVQVRYRHEAAPATVRGLGDGLVSVRFATPQAAIAPGQAAVAYEGDTVLGGGWITSAEP